MASSAAAIAVPEPGHDTLRTGLYVVAVLFGVLGATHLSVAIHYALAHKGRQGTSPCNCGRSR